VTTPAPVDDMISRSGGTPRGAIGLGRGRPTSTVNRADELVVGHAVDDQVLMHPRTCFALGHVVNLLCRTRDGNLHRKTSPRARPGLDADARRPIRVTVKLPQRHGCEVTEAVPHFTYSRAPGRSPISRHVLRAVGTRRDVDGDAAPYGRVMIPAVRRACEWSIVARGWTACASYLDWGTRGLPPVLAARGAQTVHSFDEVAPRSRGRTTSCASISGHGDWTGHRAIGGRRLRRGRLRDARSPGMAGGELVAMSLGA
jgi:hypothetical protein